MPMVNAPFFSGLPLITANCAPAGRPGGPSIHLSSAGVAAAAAFFTAAWCLVLATAGAAITNALSERRMKLFMTCPLMLYRTAHSTVRAAERSDADALVRLAWMERATQAR